MELQFQLPSIWLTLLLFIISPLAIFILNFGIRRKTRSLRLPPGPIHLPILGHLHLIDRALPHRSISLLSKKHGPIMHLQLGLKPTLVVSSARAAAEIFKAHDHVFSRRPALVSNRALTYNFSDVAFSPHNGDEWKEMRKLLVRELLNAKTVKSFRSLREAEVEKMFSAIRASSPSSQPIDLKEILITLTNNVACIAAFGRSYLDGSEQEKKKLMEVIDEGMYVLSRFFIEDFVPWMWWVDVAGGLYAKLEKSFGDLDEFYERVIQDHLDAMTQETEPQDFLGIFLRDMKHYNLAREHIKGVMMNILFGATDTSAAVVSWGMAELLRSPRALKKCQEEVRRIVGKKGRVDEDDLPQLEYLKAVVKESFRLHPPGPLSIPRECTQKCKVGGYDVLPGTMLIVANWAIGRDPEAWDDPNEFLPERFLNTSIDFKGQDFGLVPFGSGRRGCPGIQFAAATIEIVLANLLYSFDWEPPGGVSAENMDMTEASGLVTLPKSMILVPTRHDI
ncbi:hypothetical protein ACLOJK_009250 [Asimina triloba]